ncbi:MAG: ureidoglycolate lyase [Cyanobacteria bacterium REEB67]|nr:ureidoglycolate lyase [Cyanobacteria bacterium REEB67]
MQTRIIKAEKLSTREYAPYGQVLAASADGPSKPANFGRARRFDSLVEMQNLRLDTATLNVCIFRCSAWTSSELEVKVLERHAFSTQVFMPMQAGRYITIVARGEGEPDLASLRAFIIDGPQGISYDPGVWHYPMTALDNTLDLSCLVYEDGTAGDCDILTLSAAVIVHL